MKTIAAPFFVALIALVIALAPGPFAPSEQAYAQGSGRLIAIVNDEPISEYDLDQRVNFIRTLRGASGSTLELRRRALRELVDNALKRQEADRFELTITDDVVDQSFAGMSTRAGVSEEVWLARLREGGVDEKTVKQEVKASLSWRRVVNLRFGRRIQVETEDIDREFASVQQAAQAAPTYFYVIRRILLPLKPDAAVSLRNTRIREAQQIISKINGCGSINSASSGIFNVRALGSQRVPSEALPAELRNALNQVGPGRAVGPGPSPDGVVIIVYCNREKVEAPVPTREQVEETLLYQKFERIGQQFLRDLRRDAIIEYRDPELAS